MGHWRCARLGRQNCPLNSKNVQSLADVFVKAIDTSKKSDENAGGGKQKAGEFAASAGFALRCSEKRASHGNRGKPWLHRV
jgi:hypothetical protein